MSRAWIIALALAAGCGRIGFEGVGGVDAVDGGSDAPLAPGKVPLGQGADVRKVIAPEGTFQRLYIVVGDNHLMTSADGGSTFTDCGRVPNIVNDLVGTPDGKIYAGGSAGVYESTDRCATFQDTVLPAYVSALAIDGGRVLAGTSSGLRRRAGTTWSTLTSPTSGRLVTDISVADGVYLAASDSGVSRSVDGTTWALSNTGLTDVDIQGIAAAPGRIYVTTQDGVHVSTDAGLTWMRMFNNYGAVIAADPGDPQFVAHWWYGGLIVSANGGASWSADARSPSIARSRVIDILFEPDGSGRMLVASARGLFLAADHGLAFEQIGNLDGWSVLSIARAAGSGAVFYGTTTGILRETAAGLTLHDPGGADFSAAYRVLAPGDGSTIYATGRTLVTSSDQAETFSTFYTPVDLDGYVTVDVATQGGRVFVSTNGRVGFTDGAGWTFRTLGGARWTYNLLATESAVMAASELGVHVSTDAGLTWNQTSGLSRETYALLQRTDGSVLAGTLRGLYRAATPGGAWTLLSLSSSTVTALIEIGTTIIAGHDDMVSYSTDGGASFTPLPGFTGAAVSFAVEPDGMLLIGTSGYGLHRVELP